MMTKFQSTKYPQSQTKSHDVVACWVEALHGHGLIADALNELLQLISGDTALLVRSWNDGNRQPQHIEQFDLQKKGSGYQKRHSFGFDLFSNFLAVINIGAMLSLQEAVREGSIDRDDLEEIRRRTGIYGVQDIVVIPLLRCNSYQDYLEIHFKSECMQHNRALLQIIAGTLARGWSSKLPGTAEKAIMRHRAKNGCSSEKDKVVSILSPSNPLDLSRSEFRVCTLIREGLLAKSIAEQLDIKDSTVRSHLRSIYMKTETTCHAELLHRLVV